jgi:hypothetical protein
MLRVRFLKSKKFLSVPNIYWTSFIFASPANEKQNFSKCYKTRHPKDDEKGYVFPKPILRK